MALGVQALPLTEVDALRLARFIPLRCPFYWATGCRCPTCGLGRAVLLAGCGFWSSSLKHHPLGPLFVILGATVLAAQIFWPGSMRVLWRRLEKLPRQYPRLAVVGVLVYAVWGFSRSYL